MAGTKARGKKEHVHSRGWLWWARGTEGSGHKDLDVSRLKNSILFYREERDIGGLLSNRNNCSEKHDDKSGNNKDESQVAVDFSLYTYFPSFSLFILVHGFSWLLC